jgi:hypothetical protein
MNTSNPWTTPSSTISPKAAREEGRAYRAFHPADRAPDRIEFVRYSEPTRALAYSNLLDISYQQIEPTFISILYSFATLHIRGQNLMPLCQAIVTGHCARVTEFDPAHHDKPAAGQPLVTQIKVDMHSREEFRDRPKG